MGQNNTSPSSKLCNDDEPEGVLSPKDMYAGFLYSAKSGFDTFMLQFVQYTRKILKSGSKRGEWKLSELDVKQNFLFHLQDLIQKARAREVKFDHEVEADEILAIKNGEDLSHKDKDSINGIWRDEGLKEFTKKYFKYVWPHFGYYMAKLEKILDSSFEPSAEDLLRYGLDMSSHVIETNLYDKKKLSIIPMNEKRRMFRFVSVMIYVAGLDTFNINDECDPQTKMEQSVQFFAEHVNMEPLRELPWILVFTKKDILKEKLKHVYFEGGSDFETALEFIKKKYTSLMNHILPDRLKIFVVNSLDTEEMTVVFDEIFQFILLVEAKPVFLPANSRIK